MEQGKYNNSLAFHQIAIYSTLLQTLQKQISRGESPLLIRQMNIATKWLNLIYQDVNIFATRERMPLKSY